MQLELAVQREPLTRPSESRHLRRVIKDKAFYGKISHYVILQSSACGHPAMQYSAVQAPCSEGQDPEYLPDDPVMDEELTGGCMKPRLP